MGKDEALCWTMNYTTIVRIINNLPYYTYYKVLVVTTKFLNRYQMLKTIVIYNGKSESSESSIS